MADSPISLKPHTGASASAAVQGSAWVRRLGHTLVAVILLATIGLNTFTIAQVRRAVSNVPWGDQWVLIQELASHEQGRPLAPMLWSSYWGHRLVVLRLIFL